MKGQIEFSIVNLSNIDKVKRRIDSEYYRNFYLELDDKINLLGKVYLKDVDVKLDCSAFYPAITDYYNFEGEGIPFIRVNEIQKGLVTITSSTAFLPQSVIDDNSNTIAVAFSDDIVIAKGGNTLAKLGLVTDQYPYYALSRDVILIRTNKLNGINKYYLWVMLHSNYGQDLLWRTASQTGQPHLTLPSIEEIGIPRFSEDFESKFESLYKLSTELKIESDITYSRAEELLLESIGLSNFEPNSASVSIKTFKESFLSSARLDAEYYQPKFEQLIEHIKGQNYDFLKNIVDIKKSIEPGSAYYSDEGLPFLRVSDYDKFDISEPEKKLSFEFCKENAELINELKPKKGTILFSKDGSVGVACILREDKNLVTSGAVLHLTLKKNRKLIPEYLLLVLNSLVVKMQAERDAGGSIILHWRVNEIEDVLIPIVDYEKQKIIGDLVNESYRLRKESEKLLEVAKRAVEIAIEQDQFIATEYIESNLL